MEKFIDFQGKKFFYKYHAKPENNIVVALIHGLGEHIERYDHWAEKFQEYNYAFCGFDLYGHGQSDGKRGSTPSMDFLFDSIDFFLEHLENEFPDKPIVLYGHSMGGNIVANYLLNRPSKIAGCILTSPWFRLTQKPPIFQFLLAKLMIKIYPNYTDKTGLEANLISRIPEEVDKYQKDPLVHGNITPGLFVPIFLMGETAILKASKIKNIPIFIAHGTDDMLTSYKGSEAFAKNNSNVTLKLFKEARHELHNDLCAQELFEDLLDWLSAHVKYR
jgi:alpha-beta hydrolase superfamily lysophospholipase